MAISLSQLPKSYAEADKLLGKVDVRNIGSNRRYFRDDPRTGYQGHLVRNPDRKEIYIKLYDTVIVRFYPSGRIWINCGMFPTHTTMAWINTVISGRVYREKLDVDKYKLVYNNGKYLYPKVLPVTIYPSGRVKR